MRARIPAFKAILLRSPCAIPSITSRHSEISGNDFEPISRFASEVYASDLMDSTRPVRPQALAPTPWTSPAPTWATPELMLITEFVICPILCRIGEQYAVVGIIDDRN